MIEKSKRRRSTGEAAAKIPAGKTAGPEMFYRIVEHANDAIISMNARNVIVHANRKAEELYGYGPGEMLGNVSSELIPHDSRPVEERTVAGHLRCLTSGHLASLKEGVALRKNGDTFPVEASFYSYLLDGEYYITGIIRDISDRKRIERELEDARDFSDSIIESSLDPIVITDHKGHIIRTNSAFLHMLRIAQQDPIRGRHITAYTPWHTGTFATTTGDCIRFDSAAFHTVKNRMECLARGEKIRLMESYLIRTDNVLVPVEIAINPLLDKNGAFIGAVCVLRDITDRKKAEKELSGSRDFLAHLFDTSMEGLIVSDEKGHITMVNHKASELLAYAKDDLIGKHFADLDITLPDEKEKAQHIIETFLTHGKLNGIERTWKRKNGSTIDVEMNLCHIHDGAGNIIGALASFRDISGRRQADKALRISEERYRRIFKNAFVGLQEIDISRFMAYINHLKAKDVQDMRDYLMQHRGFIRTAGGMARFIDINDATLKIYGAETKDAFMASLDKYFNTDAPEIIEGLVALAEGKDVFQTEATHRTLRGNDINVLIQISVLVKQGDESRILVSIVDITHVKEVQKKMIEYQERLRLLSNELITKEENERRTFGMYLHDRIGQSLSVLKMQLAMMGSELTGSDNRATLARILKQVDETIHDTRVLSYELSPVILHELGLVTALGWLAEQTQKKHGIAVPFTSDLKAVQLDTNAQIFLYRAVNELLHNVVKHAGADTASVSIRKRNARLQIIVEDNGVGFDPSEMEGLACAEQGFGLFSIRERLHHLGGSMIIHSAPRHGTRITLLAPLA